MNKCIFMGNLSKKMEVRYGSVTVARGSMALNRGKDKDGKDRGADFINLVAFGKTAEFFERFGDTGRRFLVECRVQTGSYEKDGRKVYTTDFIVDHAEFADSIKSDDPVNASGDGFVDIPDDIEKNLPFN